MSKYVLQVVQVSKSFALYDSARERLYEVLFGGQHHRLHTVLKNINFDLLAGESVGLMGRNGAGKSTLLKLITGVLLPDDGQIHSTGRVAGLLELGTGFDLNLSGRDNIQINGQLLGMSAAHMTQITPDIIDFSELEAVIDDPVRTYSSGMVMRLGFAIAIHVKPTCFILDEALAVGDAAFQQKCLSALQAHRAAGGSLLVVSHDLNAIQLLCDRAVLLEAGEVLMQGPPLEVSQTYVRLLAGYAQEQKTHPSYGQGQAQIESVQMRHQGISCTNVLAGTTVDIHVRVQSQVMRSIELGILIKDRFGQDIFGINTAMLGQTIRMVAGQPSEYIFTLPLSIAPGHYTLTVALHGDATHLDDCEHWWDNALQFEVQGFGGRAFSGVCDLPVQLKQVNG
jgi:lipopolysaccharide transport system ATP-binding protein